jgi:glycosyltransferase involved in cell wall biosynthesis
LRYLDHKLHALAEPMVYRAATAIVVASRGLARELEAEYPFTVGKISVIANPVDIERMTKPQDFDAATVRRQCGFDTTDTVLAFTALGHFERKGLPLILEAMAKIPEPKLKLNVIGGAPDLIDAYCHKAHELGISDRVHFAGLQKDVRPFLWSADAFVFPSIYEVFSLSILEALAAGMPILATRINGVEEFARDGENVLLIERSANGVRDGIERLLAMDKARRCQLGEEARRSAGQYSLEKFQQGWRELYRSQRVTALLRTAAHVASPSCK